MVEGVVTDEDFEKCFPGVVASTMAQPGLYTPSLFGVDTMLGRERESEYVELRLSNR